MEHDLLIAMLNRLKLTAIRDQLDSAQLLVLDDWGVSGFVKVWN